MVDLNDYGSWAQNFRCYEQLKAVDDTKKNLGYELRALNNMHSLSYGYQEYLKVVIDMNDFELWSQGFRCYEQLKVVKHISYYSTWAQGFRCYEHV